MTEFTGERVVPGAVVEFLMYDFTGSTVTVFDLSVGVALGYPDADQDGIVDNPVSQVRESSLLLAYYNPATNRWDMLTDTSIDRFNNEVTASLSHFSLYALMSVGPQAGSVAKVYPNPFKPNSGLSHTVITFTDLKVGSTLRVYDMAGTLVWIQEDITAMEVSWNGKNPAGRDVVSGVYYYVGTDTQGSKRIGKLAIIR